REYRTGLHISSYILAHVIYELALCAMEALLVILIICIRNHSHLPDSGLVFPMVIDFYLSILLILFASDMIALLISCIVRSENTAMTVMPFVLIIQLVMAGTIFSLDGLTELISYLTVSKWGMNALCAIANTNTALSLVYRYQGDGNSNPSAGNLLCIWILLLVFAAIYIFISILALKRVDKDKR
ncbi:MAG: ABC transporter permease, partial [Lachnospiraceae bacterium]|nr:ABC transporter permease [Lachnospiraceae bacterium]